uniref:Pre-mRNA polyadenylation factor Fip1 domain-containing protein n=1 Tax=Ciona savignyi TaxID=51511 RepID=H2Y9N9_CIOSA
MTAPGNINGLAVMEVNLDLLEDKPWRKPGADISDYFNYGFNEVTWKLYCEKQKRLRSGMDPPTTAVLSAVTSPNTHNSSLNNILSRFEVKQSSPAPPQFDNTVRSISTLQFTRRKDELLNAINAT